MRKSKTVVIAAEGRDKGKTFVLKEMSARAIEMWALRAFQALMRAGVQLPPGWMRGGMTEFSKLGLEALFKMQYGEAVDLMDDLMSCVKIARDPRASDVISDIDEVDIEEAGTRIYLKFEVLELHTGFSMAGVREALNSSASATGQKTS